MKAHSALASLLLGFVVLHHSALAQSVVVRADRMLDVTTGRIVPHATVLVERGRIAAVNPGSLPQGAKVIDLGDVTLLPGFVDAHVHLTFDEAASYRLQLVTDNASKTALRAANNARTTLLAGFTTVRDLGQLSPSLDLIVVALADASEREWIDAPHIVACGHALSPTGATSIRRCTSVPPRA